MRDPNAWNRTPEGRRYKYARRAARRDEYLADKTCIRCGADNDLMITWIDKPGPYPTSCIWGLGAPGREKMLPLCMVVCQPCLRRESADKRRVRVHGGGVRGINGCNCGPCFARRSQYNAARYQSRKAKRPSGTLGQ